MVKAYGMLALEIDHYLLHSKLYTHVDTVVLPQVVGLGVRGVFTIIRDIWQSNPELCLKVLKEFLNILQGQTPAGLKNEPIDSTGRHTSL